MDFPVDIVTQMSLCNLMAPPDNDRDTPADRIDTSRTIPWFRIATDMQPHFLR
jgi:hypothetical protein